jgi:signal transduction histidine kinase
VRLDGASADEVAICVQNAGEIPPDVLPTIFAPYRSGRPPQESGGLGLGLYITHEIAQMHGGNVQVRSTVEAGTTFEVRLPRALRPRPGRAEPAQPFRLS